MEDEGVPVDPHVLERTVSNGATCRLCFEGNFLEPDVTHFSL